MVAVAVSPRSQARHPPNEGPGQPGSQKEEGARRRSTVDPAFAADV